VEKRKEDPFISGIAKIDKKETLYLKKYYF